MAFHRHSNQILQNLLSQDSDSGLSMPSGTMRSSSTFAASYNQTPRMGEKEHEKLIQSLLRKSVDSLPASNSAFTSSYHAQTSTPRKSNGMLESYLQPQRSASPDQSSIYRSASDMPNSRSPSYFQGRQTPDGLATNLFRSADRPLSSLGNDLYFAGGGVRSALNESQTRRNALLDKLREAQETLQLQSTRLTKMEADYHTSSYQVEELKSNESKLLKQFSELEKQKQELNELRLRDLDIQITLQDRVKEVEGALQNMVTDFQLLEADHGRRRELVDQLSTTVELIEEENRKLHKTDIEDWIVEQSINTEVQSLRRQIMTIDEEKKAVSNQLENQRREAKHWKEEMENQQSELRRSQEVVSEQKVKETNLTHKVEDLEDKERLLLRDNDELRAKDRELHDAMTDFRSRVAILTSDKERLYQEKADLTAKIENISLINKQLQEEVQGLQLVVRKNTQEMQMKDNSNSQLTDTNQRLAEELSGSQKVGERLSLELTRTKDRADIAEEELQTTKIELGQSKETVQTLHSQNREIRLELTKLQTENDYVREQFLQEKTNFQHKAEHLQSQLADKTRQAESLESSVTSLKQKLAVNQESSSQQISLLESQISSLKDKDEKSQASMQRKEDEISILTHKISESEGQINALILEQEAKRVDYENYLQMQDENQRLTLLNRRITQENTESEQMIQLLQTQRDIYARSVQEYSGKALEAERLTEESRQLQNTVDSLRVAQNNVDEELRTLREMKNNSQAELQTFNDTIRGLKVDNEEITLKRKQVEQENSLLKNAVQESYQLRQQLQQTETDMAACQADKSVISHLSEQNTKLSKQVQAMTTEVALLTSTSEEAQQTMSQTKQAEGKLNAEVGELRRELSDLRSSCAKSEATVRETTENLARSEEARKNLGSKLATSTAQMDATGKQLAEQNEQFIKATAVESQCKKLQQCIEELSDRSRNVTADNESLSGQVSRLQLELQMANRGLEERTLASRQLSSDLSIAQREKQSLQNDLERLEMRLSEVRCQADNQLKAMNDQYTKCEGGRLGVEEKLQGTELALLEWTNKYRKLTNELTVKSEQVESCCSTIATLRGELNDSADVHARQEDLIATLKEETHIVADMEAEMKEVKKKYVELMQLNDGQGETISNLRKDAERKEIRERQLHEIGTDLVAVKGELQRTYCSMNQKELELERLQQQFNNATLDAENSEEKSTELKIRLEQTEKAKEVALTTLQERIHSLEAESYSYKTEVLKLEQQLADMRGKLSNTNSELHLSHDVSALNMESLASVKTERNSLLTECTSLRAQNTKLVKEQNHLDAEKRKAQLQLRETKIDMFKLEKEKENLEKSNGRLDVSVSESNRLLKSLTTEYETATSRLAEAERISDRLKKNYVYIKEELAELQETGDQEQEQLQDDIRQLRAQVSELKVELQELNNVSQFTTAPESTAPPPSHLAQGDIPPAVPKHSRADSVVKQRDDETDSQSIVKIDNICEEVKELRGSPSVLTEESSWSASEPSCAQFKSAKMSAAEVLTDSSGDSWPDPQSQPELSDALSSGNSALGRTAFRGNDEIDGHSREDSPLRVTELPVTISIEDKDIHYMTSVTEPNSGEVAQSDVAATVTTVTHPEPLLTRDKTMKIFKQLKKDKQRSKKCLAPAPKVTKSLPDIPKEVRERSNSFENLSTAADDVTPDESLDVKHIKDDIMAKSGRVEWRGDPRESHRRFLSGWDLSIISDAEEGDSTVDTESASVVSSEYTRSLLNIASAAHTGSLDSLPSVGVLDSPLISRSSNSLGTKTSMDQTSINLHSISSEDVNREEETPTSSLQSVVTSSPLGSPQLTNQRKGKESKDRSKEKKSKGDVSKKSKSSDSKTRLPKLSLFRKKS